MENEMETKKRKKSSSTDSIRIKRDTKKQIMNLVKQLNKDKTIGQSIKGQQVVEIAVSLLEPKHLEQLKEQSLTNEDRFEQNYQNYIRLHGVISKDNYFGILLTQTQDLHSKSLIHKGSGTKVSSEKDLENASHLASSTKKVVL